MLQYVSFREGTILQVENVGDVGGFNPFEKYARQIGSFPQGSGWKFQKYLSYHHLDDYCPFIWHHFFPPTLTNLQTNKCLENPRGLVTPTRQSDWIPLAMPAAWTIPIRLPFQTGSLDSPNTHDGSIHGEWYIYTYMNWLMFMVN